MFLFPVMSPGPRSIANFQEQVRQEREKLEEKPKTSVEFLVMIQLFGEIL